MNDSRAIGIFDSGLGGLTVVKEIIKQLPNEDLVYLGDTARVPYGTRSDETIKKFSVDNTNFLLKKNIKCLVIACNTSSAVASNFLKKKFPQVPIFEMINPALRAAVEAGDRIGVIGTKATIASRAFSKKNVVSLVACPLFVPFIEEGEVKGELIEKLTKKYLKPLKKKKINTLILGCTHYPIISNVIQTEMGKEVVLINPAKNLAKDLKEFLISEGRLSSKKSIGSRKYFVTDKTKNFLKTAKTFLGNEFLSEPIKVELQN